jgi:patatin-like phospholipase/acyl hydrolase
MFKILSLDGGGIRGTYTAAVLAELQRHLNNPIQDYFDLVVGTSTGGIIALGLGCGFPPERILQLYKETGCQIFPEARTGMLGIIDRIFTPKFEPEGLQGSLSTVFGERKFCELERAIAVTSFDAASAHPVVFRSNYPASQYPYESLSVVEVGLATSAAPTYFPAAKTGIGVMIDGGVWANCPVMVGVTDALHLFECRPREVRVLSIGTTTIPEFIKEPVREGGLFEWAKPIPSILMHAAKLAAIEQAKRLSDCFIRIDETVNSGRFEMDDIDAIGDLEQMGRAIARREFAELKRPFFSRRAPYPRSTI